MAFSQTDMKRVVAYTSVSHLGFVLLGVYAFTPQALSGAVLQMVSHGISTGALFILVGALQDRIHTRELAADGRALGPGAAHGRGRARPFHGAGRAARASELRFRVPRPGGHVAGERRGHGPGRRRASSSPRSMRCACSRPRSTARRGRHGTFPTSRRWRPARSSSMIALLVVFGLLPAAPPAHGAQRRQRACSPLSDREVAHERGRTSSGSSPSASLPPAPCSCSSPRLSRAGWSVSFWCTLAGLLAAPGRASPLPWTQAPLQRRQRSSSSTVSSCSASC